METTTQESLADASPVRSPSTGAASGAPEELTLVVVDPEPVTRIGIRAALEMHERTVVVGEATHPEAGVELTEALEPSAVIIDPGRPGVSMCLEAWRRLRDLPPAVVAYLATGEVAPAVALAGADSCLLKVDEPHSLRETVQRTVDGERLWKVGAQAAPGAPEAWDPERLDRLLKRADPTARERQVLAQLLEGQSNGDIAGRLIVSRDTVKSHVRSVLHKLGVADRGMLMQVVWGLQGGQGHGTPSIALAPAKRRP